VKILYLNNRIINEVLEKRGLDKEVLIDIDKIPDYSFINEEQALESFRKAIIDNKVFGVLYDVDVDGLVAGKMVDEYLRSLGVRYFVYMSDNKVHGMNDKVVEWVYKNNIEYLIVVDAGSKDIKYYNELQNVKVLVLDHHEILVEELICNDKIIIVNSCYEGSENKNLSGSGVVYRFLKKLNYLNIENRNYESWVGLTVLSDSCSILDKENRYYVKYLYDNYYKEELFKNFTNYGSLESMFNFSVIPLLNSCIRMGETQLAIDLVTITNKRKLKELVEQARQVQKNQNNLLQEALNDIKVIEGNSLVVGRIEDIYSNITGLLATKLRGKYKKPSMVLLKDDNNNYTGSFRGDKFFNKKVLEEIAGVSVQGHEQASGVFIESKYYVEALKELLNKIIDRYNTDDYDYVVKSDEYNIKEVYEVALLNEYRGVDFEKVYLKIITNEIPEIRQYPNVTKYRYRGFEVVDFLDEQISFKDGYIIASPGLSGDSVVLLRDRE